MTVSVKTTEKMIRVLDALVRDGTYDGNGNYVLVADMPDTTGVSRAGNPSALVPSVVADAVEVLREARAPSITHVDLLRARERKTKTTVIAPAPSANDSWR